MPLREGGPDRVLQQAPDDWRMGRAIRIPDGWVAGKSIPPTSLPLRQHIGWLTQSQLEPA